MTWEPKQLAGDFEPPESVQPIVEDVHEFIETEVKAVEKEYEEHLGDPINYLDEDAKLREAIHEAQSEVRRRSAEEGFYALHLPEEIGGGGLSRSESILVHNRLPNPVSLWLFFG